MRIKRTVAELTEFANRGAKLLDEKRPGWRDEIVMEEFRIDSLLSCVICQLYGGFTEGLVSLGIADDDLEYTHGFDCDSRDWLTLTNIWVDIIATH